MNRLNQIRKDLQFAKGMLLRKPFDLLIQVTNRCNMKCSFCEFWQNPAKPKEEISLAEYAKLAKDLSKIGTFTVSIEGGEPFVRKDLVEIVRIFGKKHLPILYTNGWYATPKNVQALFEAGLHHVGISIDYPDRKLHDEKRGTQGAFERAWKAVQMFRDFAPRKGQIHVMTVFMKANQAHLEKLLQMSAKYGVKHSLTLLATKGARRGEGGDERPQTPVSKNLLQLWKKYNHFMVFQDYLAFMDPLLNGGKMPICRAGKQSFNLDHLGNLSPCIEKIDEPVGNIRKTDFAILYQKLRRVRSPKSCQDCWTLCRGYSQLMGEGGTWKSWNDLGKRFRVE